MEDSMSGYPRHLGSLRRLACRLTSADFGRTIRCAQIGPIHVWPQLLATHRAAAGALNLDTALGWNLLDAITPLTQHH